MKVSTSTTHTQIPKEQKSGDLSKLTNRINLLKTIEIDLCQALETKQSSTIQGTLSKYNFDFGTKVMLEEFEEFTKQCICDCIKEESELLITKTTLEYQSKSERSLKEIYSKTNGLDTYVAQLDKQHKEMISQIKEIRENKRTTSSKELLILRRDLIENTKSLTQNKIGLESAQNTEIQLPKKPFKNYEGRVHRQSEKKIKVKKQHKTTHTANWERTGKAIASKILGGATVICSLNVLNTLKDVAFKLSAGFTPSLTGSAIASTLFALGAYGVYSVKSKIDSSLQKEVILTQENEESIVTE